MNGGEVKITMKKLILLSTSILLTSCGPDYPRNPTNEYNTCVYNQESYLAQKYGGFSEQASQRHYEEAIRRCNNLFESSGRPRSKE